MPLPVAGPVPASGRGAGPVIRLIACDIDGTLLRGTQREISPAVFREVVRLGKQGVRFCPASGRQYHSLRGLFAPIASRLHYVCENGAVVFGPGDPGPILAKETMEREQALELCREILDMDGCEVLISGAGISYLCPKEGDIVDHVRYFVGNRTALVDRPEEITEDIVKVSAYCRRGAAEAEPVLAPRWRRIWRVAVAGEKWLERGCGPCAGLWGSGRSRCWQWGTITTTCPCWSWRESPGSWRGRTRSFCAASPGTVPGWRVCWSRSDSGWRAEREVPAPYGKSRAPCARLNIPDGRRGLPRAVNRRSFSSRREWFGRHNN